MRVYLIQYTTCVYLEAFEDIAMMAMVVIWATLLEHEYIHLIILKNLVWCVGKWHVDSVVAVFFSRLKKLQKLGAINILQRGEVNFVAHV